MNLLYPGYVQELSDLMVVVAVMVSTGSLKAFYAALVARKTDPVSSLEVTQRGRYRWLLFALITSTVPLGWMLASYGLDATMANMDIWHHSAGFWGFCIWLAMWWTFVSPLAILLAVIYVYCRPAELAKRAPRRYGKRRYYTTDSIRDCRPIVVEPQVIPLVGGGCYKHYVSVEG